MRMPAVRLPGVFLHVTISSLLTLLVPVISYPHDGKLDEYGCHYGQRPKHYHCHEGVFKLGSFGSKTQMIQLLRLQYLNLGRPWPYTEIGEEDITSTNTQAHEPPKEAKQQTEHTTAKTQQPVTENKNREIRPVQEWVVKITADGSVIYENSRRERYYFDKNGKRVDVRNGQ